ncbi:MAG TPA: hypothetical protein VIV11_01745 [Kofleriaceae bacterium]
MRISWVLVIGLALGCSKKESDKAAPAPAPAADDAATTALAADAAAAAPANPGLPSLGEPPKGMDVAKAKACDAGDAAACVAAAHDFSPKGAYRVNLSKDEADRKEAGTAKYAERACELKNAEGCYLWGKFGPYAKRDVGMSRACELGHGVACADLATSMLVSGRPHEDLVKGRELLEKACRDKVSDENYLPGAHCDRMASEWGSKRGKLKKDAKKAAEFRKLACEQGYKLECPCKKDEDCGVFDEVELFCLDDKCAAPSAD